jgi:Holliday junction resolvasome RuvABC ATP-dependent DNA helicase subunit
VAGYQKEMKNFLEANPGLESRFTEFFHLQDYTPEELLAIARKMVNDQSRMLDPGAEELLLKHFTKLWRKRDRFFSNARLVRNYIEKMFIVQPKRTRNIPKAQWTKEMLLTFTQEDVLEAIPKEKTKSFDLSINEDLLKEAQDQLNRMIGLENVKQEVDRMITLVRFYKEEKRDLTALSTHTVLKGSPGTGKTEVARILAKIYQALGILERGELIEVNRDNLISQNIGGSEKLIANYIEQAKGGTLFIDEAYQLTQYGQSDPGHKVIEVLLKRMEDDRGKFVVMAAGYKEHMEGFLDSNIGLRRRFVQHFDFNDYLPTELLSISTMMAEKTGYYIAASAKEKLLRYYEDSYQNRNETFGNAGFVRNIIEKAIKDLDYRVAKLPKQERNQELIRTITNEDISFYGDQQ